jgi:Carboxypeptidase regulatory-like domain
MCSGNLTLVRTKNQIVYAIGSILMFGSIALNANAQMGGVNGRMCDEFGAVIAGVNINFRSDNGQVYSTTSNSDGEYRLKIPSGLYQVLVENSPFTPYRLADYWIGMFDLRLDIALRCLGCQYVDDFLIEPSYELVETTSNVPILTISSRPLEKLLEPTGNIGKVKKKRNKKVTR